MSVNPDAFIDIVDSYPLWVLLLATVAVACGAALQTAVGFGFALVAAPVLLFIDEECVQHPGARVLPADLYKQYQDWCDDAKIQWLGKQNFYEQIYLNYPEVTKKRQGSKDYFIGLGLAQIEE